MKRVEWVRAKGVERGGDAGGEEGLRGREKGRGEGVRVEGLVHLVGLVALIALRL